MIKFICSRLLLLIYYTTNAQFLQPLQFNFPVEAESAFFSPIIPQLSQFQFLVDVFRSNQTRLNTFFPFADSGSKLFFNSACSQTVPTQFIINASLLSIPPCKITSNSSICLLPGFMHTLRFVNKYQQLVQFINISYPKIPADILKFFQVSNTAHSICVRFQVNSTYNNFVKKRHVYLFYKKIGNYEEGIDFNTLQLNYDILESNKFVHPNNNSFDAVLKLDPLTHHINLIGLQPYTIYNCIIGTIYKDDTFQHFSFFVNTNTTVPSEPVILNPDVQQNHQSLFLPFSIPVVPTARILSFILDIYDYTSGETKQLNLLWAVHVGPRAISMTPSFGCRPTEMITIVSNQLYPNTIYKLTMVVNTNSGLGPVSDPAEIMTKTTIQDFLDPPKQDFIVHDVSHFLMVITPPIRFFGTQNYYQIQFVYNNKTIWLVNTTVTEVIVPSSLLIMYPATVAQVRTINNMGAAPWSSFSAKLILPLDLIKEENKANSNLATWIIALIVIVPIVIIGLTCIGFYIYYYFYAKNIRSQYLEFVLRPPDVNYEISRSQVFSGKNIGEGGSKYVRRGYMISPFPPSIKIHEWYSEDELHVIRQNFLNQQAVPHNTISSLDTNSDGLVTVTNPFTNDIFISQPPLEDITAAPVATPDHSMIFMEGKQEEQKPTQQHDECYFTSIRSETRDTDSLEKIDFEREFKSLDPHVLLCSREDFLRDGVPVAIKFCKTLGTASEQRRAFCDEAQLMKDISGHINVVRLLGTGIAAMPLFFVEEYCPESLHNYLKEAKRNDKIEKLGLSVFMLTHFVREIADGLAYLQSFNFIHRDLALRNMLIGLDNHIKISDFGTSRWTKTTYFNDQDPCKPQFSLRWMAPESITDDIFTPESDIYSFGIVIWEIFTFAETPYRDYCPQDLKKVIVIEKKRPPVPPIMPGIIKAIMESCWRHEDNKRPGIKRLALGLKHLDENREHLLNPNYRINWSTLESAESRWRLRRVKQTDGGDTQMI